MKRDDSGYILPMTLVTITLMAFAALLTGRTFGVQLRASMQERLIIEERLTSRNAEHIMDAWMADPVFSKDITADGDGADLWRTPDGSLHPGCPSPPNTTCWKFKIGPTASNPLRGGEAFQETRNYTIEIRSGCVGDIERCQRTTEITRTYERAVFAQYQLHYENDTAPDAAFNDPFFDGPDGIPDTADDPPEAQLQGLRVVFTSVDELNGPLRYSGDDEVRFCGSPTFKLIESKSSNLPQRAGNAGECPLLPSWHSGTPPLQWPTGYTRADLGDRFVVKDDELNLPPISPPQGCPLTTVNYDHNIDTADKDRREANPDACPDEPGQTGPHAILDGDIITSTGSVTIERLVVDVSVTVYAEGDIIICGQVETDPSIKNLADGPNVIALITEGNVVLDPNGSTPPGCADDTLAELNTSHDLTLTNVAILAPEGAVYARRWYLPHAARGGPTLTIEGSIAAEHLGLYGIPYPATGDVTNGWSKNFTYPSDFWQARPPWWPDFTGNEWTPA